MKQRVRAVGSGHAFSDIARTDGAVLVSPVLLDHVSEVESGSLRESARGQKLVHVESGVTWAASVTRQSLREMKIEKGKQVWLAFKTYSCRLLDD